jgi:hypothetical protein
LKFEKNEKGYFILPDRENFKLMKQKQRVVRGYIGAVYRLSSPSLIEALNLLTKPIGDFTGYQKDAFPYIKAAKPDQRIYSPESVPEGFILSDPDHLKSFNIDALYSHWLKRQSKGLPPFVMVKSSQMSEKAKGKKKAVYVEIDDMDAEVEGEPMMSAGEEESSLEDDGVTKFGPPRGGSKKGDSQVALKSTQMKDKKLGDVLQNSGKGKSKTGHIGQEVSL